MNLPGKFRLGTERISPSEAALVFPQDLILTGTTRANLEKILYPLHEKRNLLLVGDAGIGKNALVYYINRERNLPTIRFSFNQDTLPEDLVGSFRVLPDGFHWQDGPLVTAMRSGYTFVADEMNLASPEILKRFVSVLESRSLQLLEKDGTELIAHPRFEFVATQNPTRGFEGRKALPESLMRLFTLVSLDTYPEDEEAEIMRGLFPEAIPELANLLVKFQRRLESGVWSNAIARSSLEHYHFNIRTGIRFWTRIRQSRRVVEYPGFDSSVLASRAAETFWENLLRHYVFVFPTEEDRGIAISLAAEVFSVPAPEISRLAVIFSDSWNQNLPLAGADPFTRRNLDILPLTSSRLKALDEIYSSLSAGENLLLEGDDPVRLADLVLLAAAIRSQPVRHIHLAKGMHTSEIIGALRPGDGTGIRWVDGPLTAGLREEALIILDNIEAAGSELIEKLNMLLDHAGILSLPPEAPHGLTIAKSGAARIVAIKRTRRSRNQGTISRALRNRFFSLHLYELQSAEELTESAEIAWKLSGAETDAGLVAHMVRFHLKINEASVSRKIARESAEIIRWREENLLRWVHHIFLWADLEETDLSIHGAISDIVISGANVHYIWSLPDARDRTWALDLLKRILGELPLDDLQEHLRRWRESKKKLNKKSHDLKMDWDPAKHLWDAQTGKVKPRLSGNPLKKGIRIDTPETGGERKEGADAWYGRDTQGNMGNGEPAGGGGAWGYRTEDLFEAFLKKYKPKWQYDMGLSLADFYEVFGRMLADLETDLENALDADLNVERRLSASGHRVDARRYITYLAQSGSDRVFDRSRITNNNDKLRGLEVVFLLHKGRRIFNFDTSAHAAVAVQSAMEILWGKNVPLKVYGYTDFANMKRNVDLVEYTSGVYEPPSEAVRAGIFSEMCDHWNGDTVEDYSALNDISSFFSPDATTRIIVMVSDFRGHRALADMRNELQTRQAALLRETVANFSRQNYVFLGVQIGSRYLAEHLFPHHLWINGENFQNAPIVLSEALKSVILRYHNTSGPVSG